jgi:hypothetical protein
MDNWTSSRSSSFHKWSPLVPPLPNLGEGLRGAGTCLRPSPWICWVFDFQRSSFFLAFTKVPHEFSSKSSTDHTCYVFGTKKLNLSKLPNTSVCSRQNWNRMFWIQGAIASFLLSPTLLSVNDLRGLPTIKWFGVEHFPLICEFKDFSYHSIVTRLVKVRRTREKSTVPYRTIGL